MIEILIPLISALASLVLGGAFKEAFERVASLVLKRQAPAKEPYSQRLSALTESLLDASKQVDSVLGELAQVARDREAAVQRLEGDMKKLEEREAELQQKIEHLEKVPLPVAEYFAEISEKGEKRGAWRDYTLFGSGVVVSTAIAIVLKLVGLG